MLRIYESCTEVTGEETEIAYYEHNIGDFVPLHADVWNFRNIIYRGCLEEFMVFASQRNKEEVSVAENKTDTKS